MKVAVIYARKLVRMGHSFVSFLRRADRRAATKFHSWAKEAAAAQFDPAEISSRWQRTRPRVLERWRPVLESDVPDADIVMRHVGTAEWVNEFSPKRERRFTLYNTMRCFPTCDCKMSGDIQVAVS